jgi:hypothetical protein
MFQRLCDVESAASKAREECRCTTERDAVDASAACTLVRVWREWVQATAVLADQPGVDPDAGIESAALAGLERLSLLEAVNRGIKLVLNVGSEADASCCPAAGALQDSVTLLAALPTEGCPWRHTLNTLATCYARGALVDWSAFYANYPGRRVELPTYAFQKKRFWSPSTPVGQLVTESDESSIEVHSHVGHRRQLAHEPETVLFEFRGRGPLSPDCEATFQAMIASATKAAQGNIEPRIEDAVLHAPFAFTNETDWFLQVILCPEEPARYQSRIYSCAIPKGSKSPDWSLNYVAHVAYD